MTHRDEKQEERRKRDHPVIREERLQRQQNVWHTSCFMDLGLLPGYTMPEVQCLLHSDAVQNKLLHL
jgi:hypothetical protein